MQSFTVEWLFRMFGSFTAFFVGGYTFQTFVHFVEKSKVNNFHNVLVYKCEKCGHTLSFRDTIPFFGSVYNRFTCRYCGRAYSKRYAVCELLGGLNYALFYATCVNCLDACTTLTAFSVLIIGSMYVVIRVTQLQ